MQHTRSDGALTLSQPFLTAADGGCVCSVTISRLYLEDHTVVLLLEGFFSTSAGTSQLATFSAPPMESSASHRRAGCGGDILCAAPLSLLHLPQVLTPRALSLGHETGVLHVVDFQRPHRVQMRIQMLKTCVVDDSSHYLLFIQLMMTPHPIALTARSPWIIQIEQKSCQML